MTVSYSLTAATASFGSFLMLFLRWRGSLWKLVVCELTVWLALTIVFAFVYHFIIRSSTFEVHYNNMILTTAQLPFVTWTTLLLGFTTTTCLSRWLDMYRLLVWPDNFMMTFNAMFNDSNLSSIAASTVRSTIARYITLSYVLLSRDISPRVRRMYPEDADLIKERLVTQEELHALENCGIPSSACHYWVPLLWVATYLKRYYKPTHERHNASSDTMSTMDEHGYAALIDEVARIRSMLGDILAYDWVPVPLAMIQIITASVYITLLHTIFVVQMSISQMQYKSFPFGVYIFTILCYLVMNAFLLGWLKCSQVVSNPFGDDDDDFELPWLIGRHGMVLKLTLEKPERKAPNVMHFVGHTQLPHTMASAL